MFSRPFLSLFAPKITAKHLAFIENTLAVFSLHLFRANDARTAREPRGQSSLSLTPCLQENIEISQCKTPPMVFKKIVPILNKKIFKIK